jgi:molybdopterin/thiamine biosynthesis adenylyltransferase
VSPDIADPDSHRARILDAENPDDYGVLTRLRADAGIEFIDRGTEQAAEVRRLLPAPEPELITEPMRWAYYPWRRAVVRVLGPRAFRAVRLDRNRNMITADEQRRLCALRIGVVGLGAGHAIAYTLAAEGLCGELRLADFDYLELSNLNRVPATVFDLGMNKAAVAARRIAEFDPYLPVRIFASGVTADSIDEFLDGLDIVVEECDSLDMKVLIRLAARERGRPVLMATSDRGLVDVERFDVEPTRPLFHGLLGDVDVAALAALSTRDKVPHMLRILEGPALSSRGAASLIEVGTTLTTWPQLAGDVVLGGTAIAEAVRRIGLRQPLSSGRVRLDIVKALEDLQEPKASARTPSAGDASADPAAPDPTGDVFAVVAAAAIRAPSGGNAQPWRIEAGEDSVIIRLAPEHTSTMDVGFRGSAVAIGAAVFNARVAAAARGVLGRVDVREGHEGEDRLQAILRLGHGDDAHLAELYKPMMLRETNRHKGVPAPIDDAIVGPLTATAGREGARLVLLSDREAIEKAATILAAADRIRYLTPTLHAQMMSELRWPGDESPDSGIDVYSLELDAGELLALDIVRRGDVMAHLADWDAGAALGGDTRDRVSASGAVGVLSVAGDSLTDYARGGSAVEAVWICAQQRGLAVQPVSPVFLYAHDDADLAELSETFAPSLRRLRSEFRELFDTGPDQSQVLVLRFSDAPKPSVRSRRTRDRLRLPLR